MSSDNFSVGKVVLDTLSKYSPSILDSNYDGVMFYGTLTLMVSTFAIYVLKKLGACASQSKANGQGNGQRRAVILNREGNDDQNNVEGGQQNQPVPSPPVVNIPPPLPQPPEVDQGGHVEEQEEDEIEEELYVVMESGLTSLEKLDADTEKCLNEFLDNEYKLKQLIGNLFDYDKKKSTFYDKKDSNFNEIVNYFKEEVIPCMKRLSNCSSVKISEIPFVDFRNFLIDVAMIDKQEGVTESEKIKQMEKKMLEFINKKQVHKAFEHFFLNGLCKKIEKRFCLNECAKAMIKFSELDDLDPRLQPPVLFHLFLLINDETKGLHDDIIRAIEAFRVKVRDDENAPNEIKEMFRDIFSCEVTNRHKEKDVFLYKRFMILRWINFIVNQRRNSRIVMRLDNWYAVSYEMLFNVDKLEASDLMFLCKELFLNCKFSFKDSKMDKDNFIFGSNYLDKRKRLKFIEHTEEFVLKVFLNAAVKKRKNLTNEFLKEIGIVTNQLHEMRIYSWAEEMKKKYDQMSKKFPDEMEKIDLVKEIVTNPDNDLEANGSVQTERLSINLLESGKIFNFAKFLLN